MENKNGIASTLFVIGVIEIMISFLIGIYEVLSIGILVALPWIIGGFFSGMLFIGFSEVINLLHGIKSRMDFNSNGSIPKQENRKIELQEDDKLFKEIRLVNNLDHYDGFLKLSPQQLNFYKGDKEVVFETPINKISDCHIDDDGKTRIKLKINKKEYILTSISDDVTESERTVYEIFNRIEEYRKS